MNWLYALILAVEILILAPLIGRAAFHSRRLGFRVASVLGLLLLTFAGLKVGVATMAYDGSYSNSSAPAAAAARPTTIEDWVGKRLPLTDRGDLGKQLSHGEWDVLLCHKEQSDFWQALLPNGVQPSRDTRIDKAPRVAVIMVGERLVSSTQNVDGVLMAVARIDDCLPTSATLPMCLHVKDGRLLSACRCHCDFPDYRQARQQSYDNAVGCGPYSLINVLRHFEMPCDSITSREILSAATKGGTSLLQLKELAEQHGLHAIGVEASAQELRASNKMSFSETGNRYECSRA